MSSCLLYHGPGARSEALEEAYRIGELMAPPIGDGGLKVDDARKAVSILHTAPFSGIGVVVIGPMNLASNQSSDVLLKVIEEFNGDYIQPILWAEDLEDVTVTIRSRCIARWSWVDLNEAEIDEEDDALESAGRELVRAALAEEFWLVPDLVTQHSDSLLKLLNVVSKTIAANLDEKHLRLWESIRLVAQHRNPTVIEFIAALLP